MKRNTSPVHTHNENWLTPTQDDSSISCIDLFCGVGGLTHGLIKGGIRVIAGIDLDPQCRFPYESNNDAVFIEANVQDLSGNELATMFGDAKFRLLAGCAPCQPFSTYSRKGRQVRDDRKWELISDFGRLVRETEPDFVTMENVPQLLDHKVFKDFLGDLRDYTTWYDVVDCVQYGIPQTRKRLVLLASRLGPVKLIPSNTFDRRYTTVRQSISHLPALEAGGSNPDDPLHTASALSDLNLRRIRASKPGGTWRDWDDDLLAQCHRKATGKTYPGVYGRMEWDAPSPTITTQCFGFGNGRFGHPEQDRAISLREAAILQTFPEDYRFVAPGERVTFNKLGRLIGNAVPVRIGEVVALSLQDHKQNYNK
jgi:DNA (cytosine-5)-methyltransferase 1